VVIVFAFLDLEKTISFSNSLLALRDHDFATEEMRDGVKSAVDCYSVIW
jgi:hypothetical protein